MAASAAQRCDLVVDAITRYLYTCNVNYSSKVENKTMAEVNAPDAALIIDVSLPTIHRRVADGTLPARLQGAGSRQYVFIKIDDLRQFAAQYGYSFDESKAAQCQQK
jgi:hypothetical protein